MDRLTTDTTSAFIATDLVGGRRYTNANLDGQVQFYRWAYTTPSSTFDNMNIDKAGNYSIAKEDMTFGYYDNFEYRDTTGVYDDESVDTNINFKPYAISDATGWCGSTLASSPNALEEMAGQVTFDFAFDAYLDNQKDPNAASINIQIVPGFEMRSYGDYTVDVEVGGTYNQHFEGSAVGNNMDPTSIVTGEGGTVDANYLNQVSFLGAGVVPAGVWVFNKSDRANLTVAADQSVAGIISGEVRVSDGATWHTNSFAGYAFLLRADAERSVTWINPDGFSDYAVIATPVPAAVWLFGSGLLGLLGLARRRKSV